MEAQQNFNENLVNNNLFGEFSGVVVVNDDPEFNGRCKVKVFGKFDNLDNDSIPWAYPSNTNSFAGGQSNGSGNISVPKIGAVVKVVFPSGNLYSPEYKSVQNINETMKSLISDTYLGSTVLYYDEDSDCRVLFTPGVGLQFYKNGSNITINSDDSISIEHKDTKSIIELNGATINITANSTVNVTTNTEVNIETSSASVNGNDVTKLGPAPAYSAILAEPLWAFLKILATGVDAKYPASPTVFATMAEKFEMLSTSTNVKVSK